jgi:hypothetical protein
MGSLTVQLAIGPSGSPRNGATPTYRTLRRAAGIGRDVVRTATPASSGQPAVVRLPRRTHPAGHIPGTLRRRAKPGLTMRCPGGSAFRAMARAVGSSGQRQIRPGPVGPRLFRPPDRQQRQCDRPDRLAQPPTLDNGNILPRQEAFARKIPPATKTGPISPTTDPVAAVPHCAGNWASSAPSSRALIS